GSRHDDGNKTATGDMFGVIANGACVGDRAYRAPADAMRLGETDRGCCSEVHAMRPWRAVRIDDANRSPARAFPWRRGRIDQAKIAHCDIARDPEHSMRVDAAQVCPYQEVGRL